MRFEKHVFICSNQKDPGKACCGLEHGLSLVEAFRAKLKEKGVHASIRVQRSGCLDACKLGPAMVIYPEGTYYGSVSLADVDEIIDTHLLGNKIVERLELKY